MERDQRFRVATFNIWNHNNDIDEVVRVINGTSADIIALQEITEEQRDKLITGLKIAYPHYHISIEIHVNTRNECKPCCEGVFKIIHNLVH